LKRFSAGRYKPTAHRQSKIPNIQVSRRNRVKH
jgi:hypothetical protein